MFQETGRKITKKSLILASLGFRRVSAGCRDFQFASQAVFNRLPLALGGCNTLKYGDFIVGWLDFKSFDGARGHRTRISRDFTVYFRQDRVHANISY
jgi:hypothetical protein